MGAWTVDGLPDLAGRTWVVTGANSGLGLHTAEGLARRGAKVILACRDPERGCGAVDRIARTVPRAQIETHRLDLADLSSIAAFAETIAATHDRLHGLVNNAGVMALPRAETRDGFEMQLGTNHLGHFALTGRLLPLLLAAPGARVVTVTSLMHRVGKIRFDDLMGQRRYDKWLAYGQSKLANLLFTLELDRRTQRAGVDLLAVSAHPGYASTNLQSTSAKGSGSRVAAAIYRLGDLTAAQTAEAGAWPSLFAAADPSVARGDFIGPGGAFQMRGRPTRVRPHKNALDAAVAAELWRVSEQLTSVRWPELCR
jgi:NAD(P)-dependent dehydrogenase (short-subunit alcohol dehydrogenase family)